MTTINIEYAADASIAVTAWTTTLLTQEYAASAIFDNTTTKYVDILVGGIIEGDTVTGVIAVGETFDIYVGALYDKDVTTTAGGGIGALLDPGTPAEEVADTDFVKANLILFTSIAVEATTPDVDQGYVFNPKSVAQFFGGVLPQKIFFVLHNNTGASLGAGSALNAVGITYMSA